MEFCGKRIKTREKFDDVAIHTCHLEAGHKGRHAEYPFLQHLKAKHSRVANKIKRDATMTTGAAWKSEDAGPNRIARWAMQLTDKELKQHGLDMSKLRPGIVAKLRDKAASYDDCVDVAIKLTWLTYQMQNAPEAPKEIAAYLEDLRGSMSKGSTVCEVCRLPLDFKLFAEAKRGKAEIETCHKDPRAHNSDNVGFAHRRCNVAQGPMKLDEFYDWAKGILSRVGRV